MKYKKHHSVLFIKNKTINLTFFSLSEAFFSDIEKKLINLDTKKASTFKILKANIKSCTETLSEQFNNALLACSFPTESKFENVSPVFKKDDLLWTQNYRPVSVLPVAFKIYERLKQISLRLELFLSPCSTDTEKNLVYNKYYHQY